MYDLNPSHPPKRIDQGTNHVTHTHMHHETYNGLWRGPKVQRKPIGWVRI